MKKAISLMLLVLCTAQLYSMNQKKLQFAQQESKKINRAHIINLAKRLSGYAQYATIQKAKQLQLHRSENETTQKSLENKEFEKSHIQKITTFCTNLKNIMPQAEKSYLATMGNTAYNKMFKALMDLVKELIIVDKVKPDKNFVCIKSDLNYLGKTLSPADEQALQKLLAQMYIHEFKI